MQQRLQDYRFASHTFPWAQFWRRKGTIKVHTLRKLRGSIRGSVQVTGGHVQDVNLLDELVLEHINSNDHSAEPNLISNQVPASYFDSSDLLQ